MRELLLSLPKPAVATVVPIILPTRRIESERWRLLAFKSPENIHSSESIVQSLASSFSSSFTRVVQRGISLAGDLNRNGLSQAAHGRSLFTR